ncbi:signal peptidase I [Enterocloster lavalensis]|uniref:Signal peptidase I n=1 Tax=Enterocloster lavalensis TaxID=460384 RepID=A0A1I0KDK7_9FIRM|nr:signal peptidase I [Enterocloster lavalensis]SEU22252.1 signal peptidase I [Enterocloster lavalensis]
MKENNESTVNWKKELLEWLKILLAAAAIALFVNTCVIANTRVPSDSMETTIMAGDRLLGSRLSYRFGSHPERGDIVIFKHKAEPGRDQTRLVKRVIGLPGETVDIRDNRIYINGSETPLEEPYLPEPMETDDQHFEVPEGCYLMLGDNRNDSADARMWADPYVPETDIAAKVFFRYYPGFGRVS